MRSDRTVWMRSVSAILCVAGIVGCSPTTEFKCDDDHTCGADGVCEPTTSFCSFPSDACPSGRSYGDLSGSRAGECTPAPDPDEDGDTIADDDDNCKSDANLDQGDEDNDTFGDVCDLCPIDGNNIDGDEDGVGDACDPHPTIGGDKITLFEGFHGGVPATWDKNGEWTPIEDDVQGSAIRPGVPGPHRSWLSTPVTAANSAVTASMTIGAALAERAMVGLVDNQAPGSLTSALVCGLAQEMDDLSSPGMALNGAEDVPIIQPFELKLDTVYRVRLLHTGNDIKGCNVSQTARTGPFLDRIGAPQNEPHNAGLFMEAARARYQWVMIVASP